MEFPTEEAMRKYLKEHPGADKSLHRVVKTIHKHKKPEEEHKEREKRHLEDEARPTRFPHLPVPMKVTTPTPPKGPKHIHLDPERFQKPPKRMVRKIKGPYEPQIIRPKRPKVHKPPKTLMKPERRDS